MNKIFEEIRNEREYQNEQWGGIEHDDTHTMRDWFVYLMVYLGKAASRSTDWGRDTDQVREIFIKIAALAVAAIEAIDRGNHPKIDCCCK